MKNDGIVIHFKQIQRCTQFAHSVHYYGLYVACMHTHVTMLCTHIHMHHADAQMHT